MNGFDTHLLDVSPAELIHRPSTEWPSTICCGKKAADLLRLTGGALRVTTRAEQATCTELHRIALDNAWRERVGLPTHPDAPNLPTDTGLGDLLPPVQESPPSGG